MRRWQWAGCVVAWLVSWGGVSVGAEADGGWGKERVEVVSSSRGRVCLNGLWRFGPEGKGAGAPTEGEWGWIRVPGFWNASAGVPGVEVRGSGGAWQDPEGAAGWYERRVAVPASWAGRAIVLEFTRLEGEAEVFIDGQAAGRVAWPGGELDVTPLVKTGGEVSLRVRVVWPAGGAALGGIGGDIFLTSRPKGRCIGGVVASGTPASGEIGMRVLLAGAGKAGEATVTATFTGPGAEGGKPLSSVANVSAEDGAWLSCSWKWPKAAVWDVGSPQLFAMKVAVEGAGIRDEWAGAFGFREFIPDGRALRLNGAALRLVPAPSPGGGTTEAIEAELKRLAEAGFNAVFCDAEEWGPGSGAPDAAWLCEAASRAGMLVIAPIAGLTEALDRWEGGDGRAFWIQQVVREVGRLGAWPSVVGWSLDDGGLAYSGAAHPARLGVRAWPSSEWWRDRARLAGLALGEVRRADPSRPLAVCGGGPLGEIDAPRANAGWAPVQEVADWPSRWAESGEMPFIALECWAPSGSGFFSAQQGWLGPLVMERVVAELGPAAYAREEDGLRLAVGAGPGSWGRVATGGPLVQEMGARFLRRVFRAWRGWGVAALPVAAPAALRTLAVAGDGAKGREVPGLRGWVVAPDHAVSGEWPWPMDADSAAQALAWIAGPPGDMTSIDHHFASGARVEKSILVVNEGRSEVSYALQWHADVAGQEVGLGEYKGHLAAGQSRFLPVEFACPAVNLKADGKIRLEGEFGGGQVQDDFLVRVYPPASGGASGRAVQVFDPTGETSRVLRVLGFKVQPWDGKHEAGRVLVIGRGALSAGSLATGSFEQFAADGGRVLVCAQEGARVASGTAFRANPRVERACWEVVTQRSHPLVRGLDAVDLRDWSGGGVPRAGLLAPEPGAALRVAARFPERWGDRGAVSVASPEKPHFGGWRPILECGFDMSYSPLMELEHGRGVIVWCSMEVDSRAEADPVARDLFLRIMNYLEGFRPAPERGPTYYTGGVTWGARLEAMGVDFQPVQAMPKVPGLLVVADDSPIVDRLIEEHMERGGTALFLPRESETLPLGFAAKKGMAYGRPEGLPPWPECRGLSMSDVRTRCDIKAPLIVSGPGEISAGGLLAKWQRGPGTALFVQVGPDQIAAAGIGALVLSECRNLAMISRLLANMGATFLTDRRAFAPWSDAFHPLPLAGEWLVRPEPGGARADAAGSYGEAAGWAESGTKAEGWKRVELPGSWEDSDRSLAGFAGAVWVRREVVLPKAWADRPLQMKLGRWRGEIAAYFNGRRLDGSATSDGGPLVLAVPDGLAVEGENVIALRVRAPVGEGGVFAREPETLRLEVAGHSTGRGYYQIGKDGEPLTSDRLMWLPDMDSNHD